MDGLKHRRECTVGVDIARCGQADTTGDCARFIGKNVAEQVVGDDHVEALRIGDHVDRGRVNVAVVDGDVRVFGSDRFDCAAPEVSCVHKDIMFVHQSKFFTRPSVGLFERVAYNALDTESSVD